MRNEIGELVNEILRVVSESDKNYDVSEMENEEKVKSEKVEQVENEKGQKIERKMEKQHKEKIVIENKTRKRMRDESGPDLRKEAEGKEVKRKKLEIENKNGNTCKERVGENKGEEKYMTIEKEIKPKDKICPGIKKLRKIFEKEKMVDKRETKENKVSVIKTVFEALMKKGESKRNETVRKKVRGKRRTLSEKDTGMSQGSILKYTLRVENQDSEERNNILRKTLNSESETGEERKIMRKRKEMRMRESNELESKRKENTVPRSITSQKVRVEQVQSLEKLFDTTPTEKSKLRENIKEKDRKPSFVSEKSPKMFLKSKSQESNVQKENISMGKNKKFVAGQNSSEIVQEIIPENAQKKDEILWESGESVGLEGMFGVKEKIAKLENLKGQSEQERAKTEEDVLAKPKLRQKLGVRGSCRQ